MRGEEVEEEEKWCSLVSRQNEKLGLGARLGWGREEQQGQEEGEGPTQLSYKSVFMSYRTDRVEILDSFQYNDSANDDFEREPYSVLVRSTQEPGQRNISLITQQQQKWVWPRVTL